MRYTEKLAARLAETGSALCVGLDPRPDETGGDVAGFLRRVVEETAPFAAAFKPNMAYFEALGARGIGILEELLAGMPEAVPVILDCKRSDIGETQRYYARAYFETWGVDAVTLNPYLGFDTVEPFLGYEGKGVYLLAVTSNPGAADLEMLKAEDGRYLFEHVQDFAHRAAGSPGDVGLVVGLTNASDEILARLADLPLLVPGLGAQGGDLAALAGSGRSAPSVVNVSRGILYADPGRSFAEKAEAYARQIAAALAASAR
ncbi:orotidine-5'-phosphate decarboxylase [soil metagenome]